MPADHYCYHNTDVLKNCFDIFDKKELEKAERNIAFIRLAQADKIRSIFERNGFGFSSLRSLHRFIFEDIYPFAGETRDIEIIKREEVLGGLSVTYSYPTQIEKDARYCIDKIVSTDWHSLERETLIKLFAVYVAQLWQVHPFREGNTRTIITFACEFMELNGFKVDRTIFKEYASFTRKALVMASIGEYSEYQYLIRVFNDSITGI